MKNYIPKANDTELGGFAKVMTIAKRFYISSTYWLLVGGAKNGGKFR
jgi:hypothetical protein